ncbi:MAG: tetratricopeptide repeat protein [bacterium]
MKKKSFFLFLVFLFLLSSCSSTQASKNKRDEQNLRLLEQNVESADIHFSEGKAAFSKREYGSALEAFQKSSFSQALFYTALTLSELGRKEDAKDVFIKCAADGIFVAESYYNLSMIAYELGDIKLAKEFVMQSIGLMPNHTGALFFAGNLFYVENDMETALRYYEKAIVTDPNSVDLWEAVFSVYLQTEKFEKGWEIRDKIDKNNEESVLNVLKVAEITGNFKAGTDFPKKEMLKERQINQQIRILLTKAGEIEKAVELAKNSAKIKAEPYFIIDRGTEKTGSYVIVFKEDSLFLVCSDKSDEYIPVEVFKDEAKFGEREKISLENVSKEALLICVK